MLADTNIKISEAKASLRKIEELETEYIEKREEKTLARLQHLFSESNGLVQQTKENYETVNDLFKTASTFAETLLAGYQALEKLVATYEERDAAWEKSVARTEAEFVEAGKKLLVQKVTLDHGKEALARGQERLADGNRKLDSDRGTLERAIERLKKNKI